MGNCLLWNPYPLTEKAHKIISHSVDLWEEYNALGLWRNTHPFALWKNDVLAVKGRVKALHIGEYVGRPVKMTGGSLRKGCVD